VEPIFWTDITPLLYYLSTKLLSLALGTGDIVLRLVPWLTGAATIPAIYLLGRELWDRRTGLGAALLLTVSAPHILYSQQARAYTPFLLFTTLSMLFLVRALRTNDRQDLIGFILTTITALYTSYLAGFLLIGTVLVLLDRRGEIAVRRWLTAGTAIVVLYIPQLPWLLGTPPSSEVVARPLTLTGLLDILGFLFNGAPGLLALGLLCGLAVIGAYRSGQEGLLVPAWFSLAGLLGTMLIVLTGTLRSRYAFPLLIPVLVIAGRGLTVPRPAVSGAIVLVLLSGAMGGFIDHQYDHQPWETAVDHIEARDRDVPVIVHNTEFRYAFHRYGDGIDDAQGLQSRFEERPGAGRVLDEEAFRWLNRIDRPMVLVLRHRDQPLPSSISILTEQYNVTGIQLGDITILRLGDRTVEIECPTIPDRWPGRPMIRCTPVTVQDTGLVRLE